MFIYSDLTRCRKVFCVQHFSGFKTHWGFMEGVGCGALISVFPDFTAPYRPLPNRVNRKHPGPSNKIQVDTLPSSIAT